MKKYKVEIDSIEITYGFDGQGEVTGEAYFKSDDYCADIVNGQFAHPYSGLKYKFYAPTKWSKSKDAILDVLKWSNVGRGKPT